MLLVYLPQEKYFYQNQTLLHKFWLHMDSSCQPKSCKQILIWWIVQRCHFHFVDAQVSYPLQQSLLGLLRIYQSGMEKNIQLTFVLYVHAELLTSIFYTCDLSILKSSPFLKNSFMYTLNLWCGIKIYPN